MFLNCTNGARYFGVHQHIVIAICRASLFFFISVLLKAKTEILILSRQADNCAWTNVILQTWVSKLTQAWWHAHLQFLHAQYSAFVNKRKCFFKPLPWELNVSCTIALWLKNSVLQTRWLWQLDSLLCAIRKGRQEDSVPRTNGRKRRVRHYLPPQCCQGKVCEAH